MHIAVKTSSYFAKNVESIIHQREKKVTTVNLHINYHIANDFSPLALRALPKNLHRLNSAVVQTKKGRL